MMNDYDLLPEWMKKFPPNYRIRLPGVGGFIQEEVLDRQVDGYGDFDYQHELPFYFYVQRTADLGDIGLPINDEEELMLIEEASAWLQTNDILQYCTIRNPRRQEKYDVDDNVYWTYLPMTPEIHEIWLNYWENNDHGFIINYSRNQDLIFRVIQ